MGVTGWQIGPPIPALRFLNDKQNYKWNKRLEAIIKGVDTIQYHRKRLNCRFMTQHRIVFTNIKLYLPEQGERVVAQVRLTKNWWLSVIKKNHWFGALPLPFLLPMESSFSPTILMVELFQVGCYIRKLNRILIKLLWEMRWKHWAIYFTHHSKFHPDKLAK